MLNIFLKTNTSLDLFEVILAWLLPHIFLSSETVQRRCPPNLELANSHLRHFYACFKKKSPCIFPSISIWKSKLSGFEIWGHGDGPGTETEDDLHKQMWHFIFSREGTGNGREEWGDGRGNPISENATWIFKIVSDENLFQRCNQFERGAFEALVQSRHPPQPVAKGSAKTWVISPRKFRS